MTDRPTEAFALPSHPTDGPEPGPRESRLTPTRLAAGAAIVVGLLAVALVIAGGSPDEGGGGNDPFAAAQSDSGGDEVVKREQDPETPPVPEPAGSDPALGATLNEEGFALIQAGNYEEAVPLLEEAVRSFPADTSDLNYAYALFNLGNALRLSGRPEEAVPVLERRLEIPNQTDVVGRELAAARSAADS